MHVADSDLRYALRRFLEENALDGEAMVIESEPAPA